MESSFTDTNEKPVFFFPTTQPVSNQKFISWEDSDGEMFYTEVPSRKRKNVVVEDLDHSTGDSIPNSSKALKDNHNDKDLQDLVKKMTLQNKSLESGSFIDRIKLMKQQRLQQWGVNPEMIYMVHTVRKDILECSAHLTDEKKFIFFYRKLFDRWKEVSVVDTKAPGYIQTDKAICLWYELLSDRCPFLDYWAAFLVDQDKRYISKDCWNIFVDFCREFTQSFAKYDFEGYWPTVTDEFVRFLQANNLLSPTTLGIIVNPPQAQTQAVSFSWNTTSFTGQTFDTSSSLASHTSSQEMDSMH